MIGAEAAISRFRRDMLIGTILRGLLLLSIMMSMVLAPLASGREGGAGLVLFVAAVSIWLALGYRSVKGSRLIADSPALIATGHFDQAEQQIDLSLKTFSLFRGVKVLSLHHLALLRHAQRRWDESAKLCRAVLSQRMPLLKSLSKPSRLLLADALLQVGDLSGAYETINALHRQNLTLSESLALQELQLEYSSRVGGWASMLQGVATKVQLAELRTTSTAARSQALLAMAAQRVGNLPLCEWLRRRVELLIDPAELVAERPLLAELWQPRDGASGSSGAVSAPNDQPTSGSTPNDVR